MLCICGCDGCDEFFGGIGVLYGGWIDDYWNVWCVLGECGEYVV